jgi:hypothetical protein
MNIRKLRNLSYPTVAAITFGGGSDPFAQAGTNIFDKAAEREQQQQAARPPAGATDWVPSQAVPGQRVPGIPADGEGGQLGARASNTSQSPLASYMDEQYSNRSSNGGGSQQDGRPASSEQQQQQAKGAFDASLQDFDGLVGNQNFVRQEDAELAAKALKGDTQALMDMLNAVGRRAVASSAFISTQVAKHGVTSELETYGKKLPTQLAEREFNTMFEGPQSGVLADKRVSALAPDMAAKFRKEYPDAPPAAIKRAVEKYFTEMVGYKPAEQETSKRPENDWGNFFHSPQ